MTAYRLFIRNQSVQVLGSADASDGTEFALIVNSPRGWIARRQPTDEGVNVSRLINQHDGAAQIAAALGL